MVTLSQLTPEIGKKYKRTNSSLVFDPRKRVEFIPSGNIIFDMISGGGFPRGRITEIFGLEHSGKTALTLLMAAQQQKIGNTGVFIDHELAWHAPYAEKTYHLVQDDKTFSVFQPSCIEEGDLIVDEMEKLDKLDYVIFDSVDAMRPKAALRRSQMDDKAIPGSHAKAMSDMVHKILGFAHRKQCVVIFINQMRSAIITNKYEQAPMTAAGYSPKESFTTTGGHTLRFYASLRMKTEYAEKIVDELGMDSVMGAQEKFGVRKGSLIKIINVKSKIGTPYLKGLSNFVFPTPDNPGGWQRGLDILELLKRRGRVRQQSAKFIYNGLKPEFHEWTSQGKANSEEKFCNSPELLADAEQLLRTLIGQKESYALLESAKINVDFTPEEVDETHYVPASDIPDGGEFQEVVEPSEELSL